MDGLGLHASIHSSVQRKGRGGISRTQGPDLYQGSLLCDIFSWKWTTLQ